MIYVVVIDGQAHLVSDFHKAQIEGLGMTQRGAEGRYIATTRSRVKTYIED